MKRFFCKSIRGAVSSGLFFLIMLGVLAVLERGPNVEISSDFPNAVRSSIRSNAYILLISQMIYFIWSVITDARYMMRTAPRSRKITPRSLKLFRWFLPRAHREEIDLILADLAEDIADMQNDGLSPWLIRCIVAWHSIRTISAYIWSGFLEVFFKVVPVATVVKRFSDRE